MPFLIVANFFLCSTSVVVLFSVSLTCMYSVPPFHTFLLLCSCCVTSPEEKKVACILQDPILALSRKFLLVDFGISCVILGLQGGFCLWNPRNILRQWMAPRASSIYLCTLGCASDKLVEVLLTFQSSGGFGGFFHALPLVTASLFFSCDLLIRC